MDTDRIALAEDLDRRLQTTHATLASARRDLAHLLAELDESRLYRELGFSSLKAYVSAKLHVAPKTGVSLARLGRALGNLPQLDAALAEGRVDWTKARDVAPILTPDTEAAWIAHLGEVSHQRLAKELRYVVRGDAPPEGDLTEREPARQYVVLDMDAADAEVLMQAVAAVRAQTKMSATELDVGKVVAVLSRRFLADDVADSPGGDGQRPPTAEPYRVVLEQCSECGRTTGGEHDVSDTVASEAACDAEVVDMTPGPTRGHRRHAIPPSVRTIVLHTYRWRCGVPHCQCRLWLDIHHFLPVAQGGGNEVENLIPLCPFHHRLVHEGLLAVERLPNGGVVVEHADGRRYSRPPRAGQEPVMA